MGTIKRFEDILAWKKSRVLTKDVYKTLQSCKDFGFKDQIQRASVSVMSNIAEGFERGTQNEFNNYLHIAKGSAGEVRAQLCIAYDIAYIDKPTFMKLYKQAEEVSKLLHSLIKGIKKSDHAGAQYKKAQSDADVYLEQLQKDFKNVQENKTDT